MKCNFMKMNQVLSRKGLLSSIYHLFDGYNPLILRKKIKELKEVVDNLDKK